MAFAGAVSLLTFLVLCHELSKGVADKTVSPYNGAQLTGNYDVPGSSEKVFNVLDYGAKADGEKDCTQPFIRAWRATCDFNGKSRLVIPKGTFLLSAVVFGGPCKGPGPKVVQVLGNLKATTDISEYSDSVWVLFESITGLVVTGHGTFDGQGAAVWKYNDCSGKKDCSPLPSNIKFNQVTNALLQEIHSINSKGVHIFITNCDTIKVTSVRVVAPEDSPNTDGIHVSSSNNVKISKSYIGTGDDCISIIKGATNVAVSSITCGPGHGISIGSLGKYDNEEDVRGITVQSCTLRGTQNGVRIKTWPGSQPSSASDMTFQDIFMSNVKNPIIIDQWYCGKSNCKEPGDPSRVKLSNIRYINIHGTSSTPEAVKLMCSEEVPCENVVLNNINLKSSGDGSASSTCDNAKVQYNGQQNPPPCK